MPEAAVVQQQSGAVAVAQPSIIDIINKLTDSPNLTLEAVQALTQLVALQDKHEEQIRRERFFEALRLCQMEMPRVQKDGLIDPKGARIPYAKLEDLDACIRPIYQKHGFTVTFDAPMMADGAKIRNIARFSCAGHTETVELSAAASNRSTGRLNLTDVQKIKQTITECRRHAQEMFFNIITVGADNSLPEDDPISENQALDIRTRMNDLPQSKPGNLLAKLCQKYGVVKPEDLRVSQLEGAIADVEATERRLAK
jgi:hypothetical protein